MKTEKTFYANIALGFREGYTEIVHSIDEVEKVCQKCCDEIGLCVTITPTKFIYKNGFEDGCFIGLIQYPRFPEEIEKIKIKAIEMAKIFLEEFNQLKVSVICSDKTYMIRKDDLT